MTALVIDTNWVLDLWVFRDPRADALAQALARGEVTWWVCPGMREECERVLGYRNVQKSLQARAIGTTEVIAHFDRMSRMTETPPAGGLRCVDPDDQVFVDLAVALRATLVSKDDHLLRLRKRLLAKGVQVSPVWPLPAEKC